MANKMHRLYVNNGKTFETLSLLCGVDGEKKYADRVYIGYNGGVKKIYQEKPDNLHFPATTKKMIIGDKGTWQAVPNNPEESISTFVQYYSSNPQVLLVGTGTGYLTAVGVGTSRLKAVVPVDSRNICAICDITVEDKIYPTGIFFKELGQDSAPHCTCASNSMMYFTVVISPSNANMTSIKWTFTNDGGSASGLIRHEDSGATVLVGNNPGGGGWFKLKAETVNGLSVTCSVGLT